MYATVKNELCEAPEEYVARPKATRIKKYGEPADMSQITHFISVIPAMEAVRLGYLKHSKRCVRL
jgi:hypothetical protein